MSRGTESPGSGAMLPVTSGPLLLLVCDLGPVIRHLCPGVLIGTTGVAVVLLPGEARRVNEVVRVSCLGVAARRHHRTGCSPRLLLIHE